MIKTGAHRTDLQWSLPLIGHYKKDMGFPMHPSHVFVLGHCELVCPYCSHSHCSFPRGKKKKTRWQLSIEYVCVCC